MLAPSAHRSMHVASSRVCVRERRAANDCCRVFAGYGRAAHVIAWHAMCGVRLSPAGWGSPTANRSARSQEGR
eukprot:2515742-Prymnesium_polylepis.2